MDFYVYKAKIISVYDGDTFTAIVDLGFDINRKMKIRLYGVDTPEIRGKEREEGLRVRDSVRELILGKEVFIKTHKDKTGSFGRYLAEVVFDEGVHLSNYLLSKGMAVKYVKGR